MSAVVCNASPLIVLAKAGWLWLLPKLFTEIYVPQAVVGEIMAGPPDDPARQTFPSLNWIHPVVMDPALSPLSVWQLGRGESEVLEYARLHAGLTALLDDRAARRAALALGVRVHGTLSILALSVQHGHVKSFTEAAGQLRAAGLYASDRIIEEVAEGLRKME